MPYTIIICLLTKWNTFSHFLFWVILIPDSLSPSPPWSHSLSPFYLIPILWFPHPRVHHSMFPLFHYLASVSLFPHYIFHPPSSDAVIPHSIWSSGSYTSSNSLFVPLPLCFTPRFLHFLFTPLSVCVTPCFSHFPVPPIPWFPD